MSTKSVDEILDKLLTEAYSWHKSWWIDGRFSGNLDALKSKSELYQLIKDRVIKKDETWRSYVGDEIEHVRFMQRNDLRASQRKALDELFGVKDDE